MSTAVIEKNKVVTLHYKLSDDQGQLLESSYGDDPMAYLHGHDNIFKVLEQALEGKEVGDKVSQALTPEQAYGQRKEDSQQRIPIKHIATKGKLKKGQVVGVQTDQGIRQVTLVKVGKFSVDIDTNHPFAGKNLLFDVEVVGVRAASSEEIDHRHAHGVGGHQH